MVPHASGISAEALGSAQRQALFIRRLSIDDNGDIESDRMGIRTQFNDTIVHPRPIYS